MPLRVAVVGGGFGGLSAALHLRARGHDVTLFEKNATVGGKASRVELGGYSFDTGPSLLTMPETVDELFSAVGEKRADHLELRRLELQCRYLFDDGAQLDFHDDREKTIAAVKALEPGDVAKFRQFLETARQIYEVTGKPFLAKPFEGFVQFGKSFENPLLALKWGVLQGSLSDVARRSLSSDRLRWIVHRYATYAGGGPRDSRAVFAMILHLETAEGAWYPMGGISALVKSLEALLRRHGVKLRTGVEVQRLLVQGERVVGVRVDGQDERFDAVVSNADPVFVANYLLTPEETVRAGLSQHQKQELGLSGAVLMLGVRGKLDHLAHHTVVFPKHYPDEFIDLFDRNDAPADPTVYLCIPSRTDATRAPAGNESVFAMINAPATSGPVDWTARTPEIRERILKAVERVVPDIRSRIEVEAFVGPDDLRRKFNAPGGSIYGVTPHGRFSPFHRPMPRCEGLTGLYFSGGGTHPGGGIPLCLRSGRFAVDLLEADVASKRHRLDPVDPTAEGRVARA